MIELINEAISMCISECKKKENKDQIEEEILLPLVNFVLDQLKPYVLGTCLFLVVITILIIVLIVLIVLKI